MTCRIPANASNPGTNTQASQSGVKIISRRAVDLPSNLPPDRLASNVAKKDGPVQLVQLLVSVSIQKEYLGGYTITFESCGGFRKLVPGQNPTMPTAAEIKRFQQDALEAAANDYAIEAFVKANPRLMLDYVTILRFFSLDRRTLPSAGPSAAQKTEPPKEQKPGVVSVIALADSSAVEKDYGAYVVGYGSYNGFTKFNKATGRSVPATDAEIRVFQKDLKAAVEGKDAAVEAFVKDNPRVLKP